MERYVKNTIIKSLAITDVNNLGYGIGRAPLSDGAGIVVFVKGAVTEDVADVKVIKATPSYLVAVIDRLLVRSRFYSEPSCPSAGKCGGCVYAHIDYDYEKQLKKRYVQGAFRKAGLSADISDVISADKDHYRNKAEFPVGPGYTAGFFSARSHRIVPLPDAGCMLQKRVITDILRTVMEYAKSRGVPAYDEEKGTGLLRHVFIRDGGESLQQALAVVVTSSSFAREYPDFAGYVMERHSGVKSVIMNINDKNTNVILGRKSAVLAGEDHIIARMCSLDFKLSLESFFQVNTPAAEMLYAKALELAAIEPGDRIADLFCGVGSIGLYMLANSRAASLTGIEIVPQAVENARKNAVLNRLERARFVCADANDEALDEADVIITDPPRKGCGESLIRRMTDRGAKRIVYISCNPDTLARDCRLFEEFGYRYGKVYLFDLFPRTGHVEAVVCLEKSEVQG